MNTLEKYSVYFFLLPFMMCLCGVFIIIMSFCLKQRRKTQNIIIGSRIPSSNVDLQLCDESKGNSLDSLSKKLQHAYL